MRITIDIPETKSCNDGTWYRIAKIVKTAMKEIDQTTPVDCIPYYVAGQPLKKFLHELECKSLQNFNL